MTKRREPDAEERALWDHVVREVEPVRRRRAKPKPRPEPKPAQPVAAAKAARQPAPAKPPAPTPKQRREPPPSPPGLDGATAERLRRGRIAPEAVLDLHGLTQDRAYPLLMTFVRRAHALGQRCLLVITGKGSSALTDKHAPFAMPARTRGVLRELVPHWLEQGDARTLIVGTQTAHIRHGGAGALYIYLRRAR